MRGYIPVTIGQALTVLEHGWENLGLQGAYVCAAPLGGAEGVACDVRLCVEVPETEMARYELPSATAAQGCLVAAIPAHVLTRLGRPQLYDHPLYNGWSRRELMQLIRRWQAAGETSSVRMKQAEAAMKLFDLVGWHSAVRLQDNTS
jgi:hypothetical protein